MSATFTINPRGIDELVRSPKMAAAVTAVAKDIAEAAPEFIPQTRQHHQASRSYRYVKAKPSPTGVRAAAITTYAFGHLVEWGSINNPAYAPLRRAAGRLGLRVRPSLRGSR